MTGPSSAYIVGAYEHPTRLAPEKSVPQLHAECAVGALTDAGLSLSDVDGYFCAGDAPGARMRSACGWDAHSRSPAQLLSVADIYEAGVINPCLA